MREGDSVAHETIWVFPASSSRFGTAAVFSPSPSPLQHAMSVSVYPCFIYHGLH